MYSQVRDAGLWMDVNNKFDVGKGLDANIDPEIRMDENITRLNSFISDFGLTKKISPYFSAQAEYRIGAKREETWYNLRHRIALRLTAKKDVGNFTLSLAGRYQLATHNAGTSDDLDLRNTRRLKATVKYGGIKKWDIASSFEGFNETEYTLLSDWRWQINLERKISKKKSVTFGYQIQKEISSQDMDFIFLLSYKYEWDKKKKKKEEPLPPGTP